VIVVITITEEEIVVIGIGDQITIRTAFTVAVAVAVAVLNLDINMSVKNLAEMSMKNMRIIEKTWLTGMHLDHAEEIRVRVLEIISIEAKVKVKGSLNIVNVQ